LLFVSHSIGLRSTKIGTKNILHVPVGPGSVNRLALKGEWAAPTAQKARFDLLTRVEEKSKGSAMEKM
jgi:hypothetical protein